MENFLQWIGCILIGMAWVVMVFFVIYGASILVGLFAGVAFNTFKWVVAF